MRFDLRSVTAINNDGPSAVLPLYVEGKSGLKLVGAFVITPSDSISCFAEVEPWLSMLASGGYNLFFTPVYNSKTKDVVYGVLSEAKDRLGAIPVQVTF